MLTDTQWAMLEPLVEQCRPKGGIVVCSGILQLHHPARGMIVWKRMPSSPATRPDSRTSP